MKAGEGRWVTGTRGELIYMRRTDSALYAFPLQRVTRAQLVRRAGGVAIWAIAAVLLLIAFRSLTALMALARSAPRGLDFRARTSLYVTAVVILPLLVFVLFVRAYPPSTSSAARRRSTPRSGSSRTISSRTPLPVRSRWWTTRSSPGWRA
jgi:hypothetical protein